MNKLTKKYIILFAVTAAAYFIAGKLGLRLATLEGHTTAVWAPVGIGLAMVLLYGYQLWPAIFISALAVNATIPGTAFGAAFAIAIGNTLEILVAAYLVKRYANGARAFERARDVFTFSFFAGVVAPLIGATIGTLVLHFAGSLTWANFPKVWETWWLGDLGGAVIIAPVLILWLANHHIAWNREQDIEAVLLSLLLVSFAFFTLRGNLIFSYLITPVFVWGAFRFSQRETAAGVFGLTEIFLVETLYGYGPFVMNANSLNGALVLLQATMAATFVTMMALTATVVEQRRAKEMLATQHEEISRKNIASTAIIESVGEGLIFVDAKGKIVIVNPFAETMLGWNAADMIGKDYTEIFAMEDEAGTVIPREQRPIFQALTTGRASTIESFMTPRYFTRKNGSRFPISITATPVIVHGDIIGAIGVFRDITRAKAVDRAKSEFVSIVSHELRTPLSIIAMQSELLKRQGELFDKHDERECREHAMEIENAVRRMARLIDDFLNVSRVEANTLVLHSALADIAELCREVLQEAEPSAREKHLIVETDYGRELPPIVTDRHVLKTVIANLVANAVKYTPPEGKIHLDLRGGKDGFTICISDTGYGIPRALQGEVFKKFFRGANIRHLGSEGTGLGLYVAKAMVEQLNGRISFKSEEGMGSSFTIELPFTEEVRLFL